MLAINENIYFSVFLSQLVLLEINFILSGMKTLVFKSLEEVLLSCNTDLILLH